MAEAKKPQIDEIDRSLYDFRYESNPDTGTKAIIELPIVKEEAKRA